MAKTKYNKKDAKSTILIKEKIFEIVNTRGKMHNPVKAKKEQNDKLKKLTTEYINKIQKEIARFLKKIIYPKEEHIL